MSINECTSINKGYNSSNPRIMLYHLGGLPIDDRMVYHIISYDNEFLKLEQVTLRTFKPNEVVRTYKIPIGRVIAIEIISEDILRKKERSVVGRGIVGGIAFGPAGLILGGMSGLKDKESNKTLFGLGISYFGKSNEEIKNILFATEAFLDTSISFAKDFIKSIQPPLETNDNGETLL